MQSVFAVQTQTEPETTPIRRLRRRHRARRAGYLANESSRDHAEAYLLACTWQIRGLSPLATYVAALGYPTGNAFSPFDSITYEAASEAEAKEKANEWANKNYGQVDARTWLQVKTLEGRGNWIVSDTKITAKVRCWCGLDLTQSFRFGHAQGARARYDSASARALPTVSDFPSNRIVPSS
jgi:hypothetical protein